jgi:hypothetical protein
MRNAKTVLVGLILLAGATLGGLLSPMMFGRSALAQEAKGAPPRYQITAIPLTNDAREYKVFLVNQETGDLWFVQTGANWTKIAGPVK